MSTDRELLDLAAKAYGIQLAWGGPDKDMPRRTDTWEIWNPRDDDGAALRLAVKLGMETYHADDGGWFAYASHPTARGIAYAIEPHGADACAATRRAIFRTAAEIGRLMV